MADASDASSLLPGLSAKPASAEGKDSVYTQTQPAVGQTNDEWNRGANIPRCVST